MDVEALRNTYCRDPGACAAIQAAADEIVRLRAEVDRLKRLPVIADYIEVHHETQRLRDALKQISLAADTAGEDVQYGLDWITVIHRMRKMAREAFNRTARQDAS